MNSAGSAWLAGVEAHLAPEGFNHVGVVGGEAYDAVVPDGFRTAQVHPGARSVVVVASGGPLLWERLMRHLERDPERHLARTSHPLDDFTKAVFSGLGKLLEGCRVLHPHVDAPLTLDFQKLGELAGLGRMSELGLVVSSRFGPWIGFRGAIFAPHELPSTPRDVRSCDGCPAPCRGACPAGVVGDWAFPWARCVTFRKLPLSPCGSDCAARVACVVAPEQRHSELQRRYHYRRAAGRRELCRLLGVADVAGA